MTIKYEEFVPSPEEYCEMRVKAGLSPKSLQAAEIGLPNSLYGVSIRDEGALIAMGRVVGDGRVTSKLSTLPLTLIIKVTG